MGRFERLSPRRWRPTRSALAVQGRYSEFHGGELASAITLSAFLSILPLLLVGIAVGHGTVQLTIGAPARPGIAPVGATRAGERRFSPNGAKSGLLSGRRSGRIRLGG
jgi:hypothetical protein